MALLLLVAMMCAWTVSSESGLCSISIHTKSRFALTASVTAGSEKVMQVPKQTCPDRIFWMNGDWLFIGLLESSLKLSSLDPACWLGPTGITRWNPAHDAPR